MRLDLERVWAVAQELERMVNAALADGRTADAYVASEALATELCKAAKRVEENFSNCLRHGLEQQAASQAIQRVQRKRGRKA